MAVYAGTFGDEYIDGERLLVGFIIYMNLFSDLVYDKNVSRPYLWSVH